MYDKIHYKLKKKKECTLFPAIVALHSVLFPLSNLASVKFTRLTLCWSLVGTDERAPFLKHLGIVNVKLPTMNDQQSRRHGKYQCIFSNTYHALIAITLFNFSRSLILMLYDLKN